MKELFVEIIKNIVEFIRVLFKEVGLWFKRLKPVCL